MHWPPGHFPGALPLPRYASTMATGPPDCPSPLVKVPIFATLSEALHQQQKQQQQLQRPYAPNLVQAAGTVPYAAPHVHAVPAPVMANPIQSNTAPSARHIPPQQGDHRSGAPAAYPQNQQHQQLQQQQRVLHRPNEISYGEQGGSAVVQGGYDGRASPRNDIASQSMPSQDPVSLAMPLRPAPIRMTAQVSQVAHPPTPSAGLGVQTPASVSGSMAAPPTPVMLYTYPQGYMMAYPSGCAPLPLSTRSQTSQRWNPYECVSPSGESVPNGFGRGLRSKGEVPAVSREHSPAAMSSMSVTSSLTSREESCKAETDDEVSQGARSRSSSNLSDVIERGFYDEEENHLKPSSTNTKGPGNENVEEGDFKTPSRVRKPSFSSGVAPGREDKENTRSHVGVVGGGRGSKGNADGSESRRKQLSGKKRGGDDIAKQQSFTGSYFQVSPSSFLQPSKRRRNLGDGRA